jgi:hypothetical protein
MRNPSRGSAVSTLALAGLSFLGLFSACERTATGVPRPVEEAPERLERTPAPEDRVHFRKLRTYLPSTLQGWKLSEDEGSTGKYGTIAISEVKRVFTAGERELSVQIIDSSNGRDLGSAISAAADDGRHKPGDDPTAPVFDEEVVGFAAFAPREGKADLNLWVAGRFVVALSSRGVEGTQEVRLAMREVDVAGLTKLR